MNTFPDPREPLSDYEADPLTRFELSVARRADEISRGQRSGPGANRDCWLLAEAEMAHGSLEGTFNAFHR